MDGGRASRAYRAFCRWRASLGVPLIVVLGPVGWLTGQGRPERAPSPVRAPIAGEKTGRALLVVSGAGGWLRLAARCGAVGATRRGAACERSRSAGSRSLPGGSAVAGGCGRGKAGLRRVAEGRRRGCGVLDGQGHDISGGRTGRSVQGTRPRSGRGLGPAPRRAAPRTHTPRASLSHPAQQPPAATRLLGFLPAMGARTGDGARSGHP
jgi:hypothetical protein